MPKIPKKIKEKLPKKPLKDKDEQEEEEKLPGRISSDEDKKDEASPLEDPDYLRPYQYKKVNNKPQVGGVLTDPDSGSKAAVMKAHLLSLPRVDILIPLEADASPKVPYSWGANGYRLDFPVNQYISVPKQVADDIKKANNQTIAALGQFQPGDKKEEEE